VVIKQLEYHTGNVRKSELQMEVSSGWAELPCESPGYQQTAAGCLLNSAEGVGQPPGSNPPDHGQPVLHFTQIGQHFMSQLARMKRGYRMRASAATALIVSTERRRRNSPAPKGERHQRLLQAVAAGKTLSLSAQCVLLPQRVGLHTPTAAREAPAMAEARDP
jgi:hypothetical protein